MSASILPFPTARRAGRVRRTAAAMARSDPKWSDAHLRQQLRILAQGLRAIGVDDDRITDEVNNFEVAIRAELQRHYHGAGGAA